MLLGTGAEAQPVLALGSLA